MTIMPVLYSSATDEWSTPQAIFAQLDRRYRFTLDPCATSDNAKCPIYFTREQDGLKQDWGTHRVFCNPPYGRTMGAWARNGRPAASRSLSVWWNSHGIVLEKSIEPVGIEIILSF
jgi:phage N-6-adenine-methyltransferase